MLSIQPLESAEGATDYYLNVVNYYANDSKSVRWLGQGAADLGIHGQTVEKEQMLSLLQGKMPDGTQLGRVEKGAIQHRPGFDMTLGAPKSFSIILESGADPRLVEVWDTAVEWFVQEMEQEFAQTRQVLDGKVEYVDTKNFVIAAFRQSTSRANEPHTHTHLVVQNMTKCLDGNWRSLASDMDGKRGVVEQIMKHHIYGGLKFRNYLASLTSAIGYEIASDGDGLWEIKGVPENLIEHFSTRREEIEASMQENGLIGAKGAAIAAAKTREDKQIVDFVQWQKGVISDCKKLGFDPHKLAAQSLSPKAPGSLFQTFKDKIAELYYGKEAIILNHAKEAVHIAIESVSQQQAVFALRTLKKEALKHAIASTSFVDEKLIDAVIVNQVKSQNLYQAMHPYTRQALLTTPWQLTLECEAVQRIENGKGTVAAICSKQTVSNFIKNKEQELQFSLSPSQKRAMTSFLTTKDRFIAIQGYAGTGKTTMLRLTNELAAQQGYTIRGITAGSSAAHELQIKGGLEAATFARELSRLQQQRENLQKTIFVVDEASMLSNPQGHKIIKLVEQFNTQLKIIGDRAQLPTPSSGKLFSMTQDYGIDTTLMTDNLRQTDAELKESAIHAGRGEIYDAVEKLTHVKELDEYSKRIEYMANKWLSLTRTERSNTLCFAPTHKNRHDITAIIRDALKNERALVGVEHKQPILKEHNLTSIKIREAVYYSKQDVIRFNNTIARYNIQAGEYLTVGAVTKANKSSNTLSLTRENGSTLTFKLAALPEFKAENKDLERPIEIYRKADLAIMAGDRIQFKRNFVKQGIRNSELGRIQAITPEGIQITTDENVTVNLKFGAKELQHLDHGYVLTTYAAQGKDKKQGLSLMEGENRFASTMQNYYVTTTRGISAMTVVTDNKDKLIRAITTNDSDKYSSLEMVDADTLMAHQERFKEGKDSIMLQNVIEKKLAKEQEWSVLESTVGRYADAKQQEVHRVAAKVAYAIVNDPRTYRLAKERLEFTSNSYRRDAFTFATAKLFNSLSAEERQAFSVVRQYVALNKQIAKRVEHNKAAFPLVTVKSTGKDQAPKTELVLRNDSANKNHLMQLTMRRNALASLISIKLSDFKPYLKHYSIGELNRIGLPQYELRSAVKKSQERLESLAKHATLDKVRENVATYLTANVEKREMIAAQIRRDAKLSHPFVLDFAKTLNQQPEQLWKSIHQDAREHSDKLFRNGLSIDGKLAFDKIKAYKELQKEIYANWSEHLQQAEAIADKAQIIPDLKSKELFTIRNELANELIQNKALPEVAAYFKLDTSKLTLQQQSHHYQNNVQRFIASGSNFQARLTAIYDIKNDIKGHYPFIKELGVDTKILSKFMRVTDRAERLDLLTGEEKNDYKRYLNYKHVSTQAYKGWQTIHQDKAKPYKSTQIAAAITLSAHRDYLANQLARSPYINSILTAENGNKDKILVHSDNHNLKVREVTTLNNTLQTLFKQYANLSSTSTSKERTAWKNNWNDLNQQLKRIEKGHMYRFALQDKSLDCSMVEKIRHELRKYDTDKSELPKQKAIPLAKILQPLQKSAQYLDAKLINESLMSAPEITYKEIWGEPKSQNTREMRYSGGLIVTLTGSKQGLWHDFTTGVGGAPIQAVMHEQNVSFQEAIKIAAGIAGIDQNDSHLVNVAKTNTHNTAKQVSEDLARMNKIISAKSIWNSAINAKGTIAEKYLTQHRGINKIDNLDIRYWPPEVPWKNCNEHGILEDKVNKIPALIFAARNAKGELTGVQRIYLDPKNCQ